MQDYCRFHFAVDSSVALHPVIMNYFANALIKNVNRYTMYITFYLK